MNKFTIFVSVCAMALLTSCATTKMYHGTATKHSPLVKINSTWNHHLLGGFIPIGNVNITPAEYVGNAENFMVKTNTSVTNYFFTFLTGGFYAPTQTKFYVLRTEYNK